MPRKSKQQTEAEKKKLKDKILTDLYLQRPPFDKDDLHALLKAMCKRYRIAEETYVHEDIYQTVFLELSKKSADYIIELYENGQNPKRLRSLAFRIALLKGFAKDDKYPELPSHSVMNMIKHASNFNINTNLNQDIIDWNDDSENFLIDNTPLPDSTKPDAWKEVAKHLTPEELEVVEQELYGKKLRGRTKKNEEHKSRLSKVKRKIKRIVKTNNIEL